MTLPTPDDAVPSEVRTEPAAPRKKRKVPVASALDQSAPAQPADPAAVKPAKRGVRGPRTLRRARGASRVGGAEGGSEDASDGIDGNVGGNQHSDQADEVDGNVANAQPGAPASAGVAGGRGARLERGGRKPNPRAAEGRNRNEAGKGGKSGPNLNPNLIQAPQTPQSGTRQGANPGRKPVARGADADAVFSFVTSDAFDRSAEDDAAGRVQA
ncbi:MAG: hypothetical protein H7244_03250, partial [Herminiimonas sp.]|nr:hypothetical protein [Herminiimonas sp.]